MRTRTKLRQKKRKKKNTNWNVGTHRDAMAVALESMHMQGNAQKVIAAAIKRDTPPSSFPDKLWTVNNWSINKICWQCLIMMVLVWTWIWIDLINPKLLRVVVTTISHRWQPTLTVNSCGILPWPMTTEDRNFGMSRQEMISIIAELKGSPVTTATAKNHYLHRLTTSIHQSLCLVLVFSCNKLIVGLGNLGCVALLFDDKDLIWIKVATETIESQETKKTTICLNPFYVSDTLAESRTNALPSIVSHVCTGSHH